MSGDAQDLLGGSIEVKRLRALIAPFLLVAIVTVGTWGLAVTVAPWDSYMHDPMASGPPDVSFTFGLLAFFMAGVVAGVVGGGGVGWIGAAGGLVGGNVVAAAVWNVPVLAQPTTAAVGLVPLTVGYAIGQVLTDPMRRRRLVIACGVGLWLPFAALTTLGLLAAVSSPGLGEGDWPTVLVAGLVTVLIPPGLLLIRAAATRLLGRLALVVVGWGVAAWALLDGGYGRPLWDAHVSVPLIAIMLTGVILGLLLGGAAFLYRAEPTPLPEVSATD